MIGLSRWTRVDGVWHGIWPTPLGILPTPETPGIPAAARCVEILDCAVREAVADVSTRWTRSGTATSRAAVEAAAADVLLPTATGCRNARRKDARNSTVLNVAPLPLYRTLRSAGPMCEKLDLRDKVG